GVLGKGWATPARRCLLPAGPEIPHLPDVEAQPADVPAHAVPRGTQRTRRERSVDEHAAERSRLVVGTDDGRNERGEQRVGSAARTACPRSQEQLQVIFHGCRLAIRHVDNAVEALSAEPLRDSGRRAGVDEEDVLDVGLDLLDRVERICSRNRLPPFRGEALVDALEAIARPDIEPQPTCLRTARTSSVAATWG